MRNRYEVREDITLIYLDRRGGSVIEAYVDTTNLPALLAFPCKWCAAWRENVQDYYVTTQVKGRTVYLHRWLMKTPKKKEVDHRNHETRDNRRENLRNVTPVVNCKNRHRRDGVYAI